MDQEGTIWDTSMVVERTIWESTFAFSHLKLPFQLLQLRHRVSDVRPQLRAALICLLF